MKVLVICSFIVIAAAEIIQSTDETCARVGELCRHHEDCCSGSCPSYLAKCVYNQERPDPPIDKTAVVVDDTIAQRVDGEEHCLSDGGSCDNNEVCCSGSCLFYAHRCVSSLVIEADDDEQREKNCIEAGGPCNVGDECCSGSCQFYAHKCAAALPLLHGNQPQVIAV